MSEQLDQASPNPDALIPGPTTINSEDFADMIMASLKTEGIDFERAVRVLNAVGAFCVMQPEERATRLTEALGTWKTREVAG